MRPMILKHLATVAIAGTVACSSEPVPPDADPVDRFAQGALLTPLGGGGYIDSIFLSYDSNRLYFLYSTWNTSDFLGGRVPQECPHGPTFADMRIVAGLEYATDLFFVEWDGNRWSAPQSVGSNVNSAGLECCVWLNDDETEMIFGSTSGDRNGNYMSTRADKGAPWGVAQVMAGRYGPDGRETVPGPNGTSIYVEVTDLHRTPSRDLYGWETDRAGMERLVYGRWNGSSNDAPVVIPGSEHHDTQVWVSDDELVMLYNHRTQGIDTTLRTMTRPSRTAAWSAPSTLPTPGFADPNGLEIWGEPTLTADGTSMLFVRFNTRDSNCWRSEIVRARGTPGAGYADPEVLN